MRLDRHSPLPLWAQLEAALKQRLDAGDFDERFPTDNELVEEYGVSRHTVREAIRHLNRSGILRRERGRGTVVNRSEFEQPLGTLYSLFRSVESSGALQRSTTRPRTSSSGTAERLCGGSGATLSSSAEAPTKAVSSLCRPLVSTAATR